jgi:hypothetical protein
MVASEEIGMIAARLAIHDEYVLANMLQAASSAGNGLLNDELGKLALWATLMRALRLSLTPHEKEKR